MYLNLKYMMIFQKSIAATRHSTDKTLGDYFFKETEDLVDKLCDDFEITVRETNSQRG